MPIRRVLLSAAVVAGLTALPLGSARAQYYEPCSPFPLFWPFCIVGAVVSTAASIATAPLRALTPPPPYPYYGPPPYYPSGPYSPPPPYYPPG
jgi:hypothetical protein